MKLSLLSTALGAALFASVLASDSSVAEPDSASDQIAQAVAKLQSPQGSSEYTAGALKLRELADGGNPEAMIKLGQVLEKGTGIDDFEYAISYYRRALEAGYGPAANIIASSYLNRGLNAGVHTSMGRQYLSLAYAEYKELAAQGSVDGLWNLGYLLTSGYGVDRDHELGYAYITQASSRGNAQASFWLANFYRANPGAGDPEALRIEYLQRAAGQGSHMAKALLRTEGAPGPAAPVSSAIAATPSPAPPPEPVATRTVKPATSGPTSYPAAASLPPPATPVAATTAGSSYEELDRTRQDLRLAQQKISQLEARLQSYEIEYADGQALNQQGLEAVMANDYELAAARFRQASDLNHAGATSNLGTLYLNGSGVVRDGGQAVALFERAVKLGNVTAAENLGRAYQYGLGVHANRSRAIRWYMTAEDMGSTHATDALHAMHQKN